MFSPDSFSKSWWNNKAKFITLFSTGNISATPLTPYSAVTNLVFYFLFFISCFVQRHERTGGSDVTVLVLKDLKIQHFTHEEVMGRTTWYSISMVCLWYFYGISMSTIFLWYVYGISMSTVFLWYSSLRAYTCTHINKTLWCNSSCTEGAQDTTNWYAVYNFSMLFFAQSIYMYSHL